MGKDDCLEKEVVVLWITYLGWENFMSVHTISLLILYFCLWSKYHIKFIWARRWTRRSSFYISCWVYFAHLTSHYLQVHFMWLPAYTLHMLFCSLLYFIQHDYNVRVHAVFHQSTNKIFIFSPKGMKIQITYYKHIFSYQITTMNQFITFWKDVF